MIGTDGIRGKYGSKLISEQSFFRIGQFFNKIKKGKKKFGIITDTRSSSYNLLKALYAGLNCEQTDVGFYGQLPTPSMHFIAKKLNLDYGFVITASHNNHEDNGIKIFDQQSKIQLSSWKDFVKTMDDIQKSKLLVDSLKNEKMESEINLGKKIYTESILDYINIKIANFPKKKIDLSIAIDCANGSSCSVIEGIIKEFAKNFVLIENSPNGLNINDKCGSTYANRIKGFVNENKMEYGISLDGDGDRCIVYHNKVGEIDGQIIMYILYKYLFSENKNIVLSKDANTGLDSMFNKIGCNVQHSPQGDINVLYEMNKIGSLIGGEPCGHIILKDLSPVSDGIVASILTIYCIENFGIDLSEIRLNPFKKYNIQYDINNVNLKKILDLCKSISTDYSKKCKSIYVRPSGTENLIRVYIEDENADNVELIKSEIDEKFFAVLKLS